MILSDLLDYETLRIIWWVLLGVLLIGFAAMDGFDLGVGTLLPFIGKTDIERRIIINTIGPVWEGNQVWLILGGGAIFAAWPPLYAVSFSGFYLAMFAILFALILRPVGFKFRSKRDSVAWRTGWDWALFIGGFVPSLIFGVAVGNVLQGVPFRFNDDLQIFYDGTFFGLLNPFALLCGVISLTMLIMHGSAWLVLKTTGVVQARARAYGSVAALLTSVLYVVAGVISWYWVSGYKITSAVVTGGPSNPLRKAVELDHGAWFANYMNYPVLLIAPALGILGPLLLFVLFRSKREVAPLLIGKLSIFGIISSVGVSMFPFILPSSADPRSSLTVWDASSSHMTLFIMLVVTLIFLPLIVAYTSWVYKVLWGKVEQRDIEDESNHAY
ncbi:MULTISPECIES: cytochrome d ubiquinol oxidase subunit II [Brucella]|uniref:cytochrome d ubiquinol oxidase subunit II n=1 Tax=Brucella TaxID=234 RepID=UPI000CFBA882|nr:MULTISPECIES: cytochrome d ubiquinol oxidase subunit II [Brucella]MBK0021943.1 cytochrome d ubiquinol oxidase subunit II [Ochrobactrum sp. S45]MBK0043957.1 cytochrome d ubiquinol oxidase subunit II [Ochrobactrum sp. S46]MQP42734.1 cytochrome d ubiquinol oxidase subunit II [Ochrobactrum sp. MYb237]PQZ40624.1 cytochrome d ubiquinol oxidase subunit II [Brucella pseudogrignonensis]PRA36723.1 cytochrome d ubiquinol oxidase subunit II [Brucella pseudogrignonensis]